MYKTCKTERSWARQKMIESTLLEMMKHENIESISITDLCAKANIPRKAFYRYFDSKDAALRGLVEHTLAEYQQMAPDKTVPRSIQRELEPFFVFWYEHAEFLRVLDANGLLGMVISASTEFAIDAIIPLEKLIPDEDERMRGLILKFAIGGLMSIMLDWYRNNFRDSVPEIARRALRILSKAPFPYLATLGC